MAQVTLSGTPSFVQSSQWNHFLSAVELHVPLQNLHWKSATRPSIRTIQQLEITLSSLDSSTLDARPQSLILDSPLLHVYVLTCDVSCLVSGVPHVLNFQLRMSKSIRPLRGNSSKTGALAYSLDLSKSGLLFLSPLQKLQQGAKSDFK